jgi:LmbE family N-acetylglucosaminyl deacetylase
MSEEVFPVRRAMVVHAHPDDAEFSCGGTIARMAADGVEWTMVVATSGNRGGEGDRTEEALTRVRVEEQRAAADVLGINGVVNLGYDDGSLTPSLELRRDITRQIRKYQPDLVVTANPVRNFGFIGGNHPDHLAVGEATLSAVYPTARNPMAVPELLKEGLEKWVVTWVYVTGATLEKPNHYVDVSDYLDRKIEALLRHKSQLGDWVDGWIRVQQRRAAVDAREAGAGEMEYAEAFYRMYTGELNSAEAMKAAFGPLREGMELPQRARRGAPEAEAKG